MRGRGENNEQKLELAEKDLVNTLTTVQKDNMVLEAKTARGQDTVQNDGTPTITAQGAEDINYVETQYRIRKLTPRECWRLMGYTDNDYDKASAVNSNTQLYKEAGNAIVKQVLMAIFAKML